MPLRSFPSPLALRLQRTLFHTSTVRRDEAPHPNHYETLQIPIHASPSEIKKAFYSLSKTHHPDRNPNDPKASHRFVQISEAYSVLSSPEIRQNYDREHIYAHNQPHHSHYSSHPRGSYHSSGPAGGRPASGLSRRRTQFHGPPPSFYRSGAWGEHSEKRRAAQNNDTPGAGAPSPNSSSAEMGGGMGTGEAPFGMGDVPHFDKEGHYRTQENQDKRWQRRRDENFVQSGEVEPSTFTNFFMIGGILGLTILLPSLVFSKLTSPRKRERESR